MANIKLRSPYFVVKTLSVTGSPSYATMELTLNGASTPQYTITKDYVLRSTFKDVVFDISELSRDYLDITFDGTYTSQQIDVTATVKSYNTSGTLIDTTTFDNVGFDGWSEFSDGVNDTIGGLAKGVSVSKIYVPEDTAGVIPSFSNSGTIVYNSFTTTDTSITIGQGHVITIQRICEPKFNPIKVTFVNAYGALQDIWFDKKSVEELSIKRESFKRNLISATGTYSTTSHSKKILNVMGNESITMNTGFVDEGMNEVIKELMLSEQAWATIGSTVYPMNVEETSHTYKTSVNDRLVNYTVKFSYAFDLINNIR
jgi:hypothetical protein